MALESILEQPAQNDSLYWDEHSQHTKPAHHDTHHYVEEEHEHEYAHPGHHERDVYHEEPKHD